MRRRENLVWMFLMALLMGVSLAGVGKSSSSTSVDVNPWVSAAAPGGTFDIYVTAREVSDLFLAEFNLTWDPPLLYTEVAKINPGDVAPYLENILIEEVNNDAGWLHVVVGRPIGVKTGLSGTVQMAKINFLVEATGSCALHLSKTDLMDVAGAHPTHTTEDGYFTTVYPILWIRKHGAKIGKEWGSGAVGQLQTLYAKIVNTGGGGGYVKVNFTLYQATADGATPVESNVLWIDPGGSVTVSAEFTPLIAGLYYVKGALYLSFDGLKWHPYYEIEGVFGGEGLSRDVATKFSVS